MAGNVRISQLPGVSSVQPTDLSPVVANGTTSKITIHDLVNSIPATASISASYAATASSANDFIIRGDLTGSNALFTGTITAQKISVQYVTASTELITGSTKFGTQLTNTHQFTGSVTVTGSLSLNDSPVVNNTTFTPFSSSVSSRTSNLETTASVLTLASASFLSDSGSNSIRLTNLEVTSSVLTTASASFDQASGSLSVRTTNLESTASALTTASGSFSIRTSNLESTASVLTVASASFAQISGSNSTRITNLESTASVLTTASASFAQISGSNSIRITNLESTASVLTTASSSFAQASGSFSTRTTNLESTASVLTTASSSFAQASGSTSTRITVIEGKYLTTGSNSLTGSQIISGSLTISGSVIITGSLLADNFTGSLFGTSSRAVTSSNALTASSADTFIVRNNLTGSNALFTGGITAQTLVVQTVTSSIVYSSGSNRFGSLPSDVQQMTGSLRVTGSGNHFILGGNVGVGTTAPNSKLEVSGGAAITTLANSYTNAGILHQYNSSNLLAAGSDGTSMLLQGVNATNNSAKDILINPLGGNVGIGTTSITNGTQFGGASQINRLKVQSTNYTCLEVNGGANGGSLQFTYGTDLPNQVGGLLGYNHASGTVLDLDLLNLNTGSLKLGTSGSERMRITSAGNVGIGMTNPTQRLHVSRSGASNYLVVSGDNNAAYDIASQYTDGTNNVYIGMMRGSTAITGGFTIWTGGTQRVNVTSGGSVGIGTTNPSTLLHVTGSPASLGVIARFNTNTSSGSININHAGNGGFIGYANLGASNQANVFYVTTGAGTIGSGIHMDNGGNFGIGVTNPSYRLHVTESIYVTSGLNSTMFTIRSSNDTGALISFKSTSAGSTDNYSINHSIVHGTGNGYQIEHNATTRYIRMVAGSGGVELLGTATAWTAVSDIRKKDVLQLGIPDALQKISGIDAIFYKYKSEELLAPGEVMPEIVEENKPTKIKQRRVGLIAQQVLSALPEAVNYSEHEDVYKLSYTEVIPLMIEAIKELKAENDAFKAEINSLKAEITQLKSN